MQPRKLAILAGAVSLALGGIVYVGVASATGVAPSTSTLFSACLESGTLYGVTVVTHSVSRSCKDGGTAVEWSITGPAGARGATGPQGATGEQGPPGPAGTQGGAQYLSEGLVSPTGTVIHSASSTGVTVTITRVATGEYRFVASGFGTGSCPTPTFTAWGNYSLYEYGGVCRDGSDTTDVYTSNGDDELWSYHIFGIGNATNAQLQSFASLSQTATGAIHNPG